MWSGRFLATLAPATASFDPATTGAAAGLLLIVGLSAVLPVALRAARTDPQAALRGD
jgi:hypothetical protein